LPTRRLADAASSQTAYRSVFPKANRTFDSSLLSAANCDQAHFTIRLVRSRPSAPAPAVPRPAAPAQVDHLNRTDGEPIVWGAVVGLGEQFTFQELLEFPLCVAARAARAPRCCVRAATSAALTPRTGGSYILRNHGETWNDWGWSWWWCLFVFSPLLINGARLALVWTGHSPLNGLPIGLKLEAGKVRVVRREVAPRELFYEKAVIGFTAAALEEMLHLLYVQGGNPVGWGFWVGLFLILLSQVLPLLFVLLVWRSLHYEAKTLPKTQPARCWAGCLACSKPAFWAPLEFLTGFSFLLWFGAGFYIGPAAVMLAALVRLTELQGPRVVPVNVEIGSGYGRLPTEDEIAAQNAYPSLFMRERV
jgi:hypothetical protein